MKNKTDAGPKRPGRVLIGMPDELRAALDREAFTHSRTLTAEVNMRLRESLEGSSVTVPRAAKAAAQDLVEGLSPDEARLLLLFKKMAPEKRAALLELLK